MGLFYIIVPFLLYVGIIAVFIYVVYRMVDRWVDKILTVRREQNALLARLVDHLNIQNNNPNNDQNDTL